MKIEFKEKSFSHAFMRLMETVEFGGASTGDCVNTAQRILSGDFESWQKEWMATAEKARRLAGEYLAQGQLREAREAFLHASTYYRAAKVFLHALPGDPHFVVLNESARACFDRFIRLSEPLFTRFDVPYLSGTHTGCLYRPDGSVGRGPLPTLIVIGGPRTSMLEMYYGAAVEARHRGYACITIQVLRSREVADLNYPCPHRVDFMQTALTKALKLPDIDPERIGLVYLQTKAVPGDHGCVLSIDVKAVGAGSEEKVLAALNAEESWISLTDQAIMHSQDEECPLAAFHEQLFSWFEEGIGTQLADPALWESP